MLVLAISGVIAALLSVYAILVALRQKQIPSTDLSKLWPPRYFLGDVRRDGPPVSSTLLTRQQDAPPTAQFERPVPPTSAVPAPQQPLHPNAAEITSRIPHEALQPPSSADSPPDRTSQIQHPVTPSEPE